MRELKFRAWDKENRIWVDFDQFPGNLVSTKRGIELTLDEYDDLTWIQFTGIRDKNGREIWEGDIVRVENCSNGEIIWNEIEAAFTVKFPDERQYGLYNINVGSWVEVIGNIYEHPELLKAETTQ